MLEKTLCLFILATFVACGGLKHLPPTGDKADHELEEAWSITFKLAQELSKNGNMEEACVHWNNLAQEKEFPLSELAFIYHLYCLKTGAEIDLTLATYTPSKYLRRPYHETLARSPAVESERPLLRITSLEAVSSLSVVKAEKNRALEEALKTAHKVNQQIAISRIQQKLQAVTPPPLEEIKEDRYLDVAKNYIKEREYTSARRYLERIIFKKQERLEYLVEAWKIYAKTFKSEQDREKYKLKLDALFRYLQKEVKKKRYKVEGTESAGYEFLHEVGFELARAEWTDDADKKAIDILGRLIQTEEAFQGKYPSEIDLLLGKIYLSKNALEKSQEYFDKIMSSREVGDQTRADILHNLGFYYILRGQWPSATPYFERALKLNLITPERNKFLFWLAKIKKSQGIDPQEDFKKLVADDPLSFYGIVSAFEINQPLTDLSPLDLSAVMLDEKFEWFIHFHLFDLANQYITLNTPPKKSDPDKTLLLLSRANQHHEVFYRLNKMDNPNYDRFTIKYPTILIPTPYFEIFKKGASFTDIEIELLLAIAKQESGFYEFAKSPADAFGLMQIIMPSAEIAAKRAKLKITSAEDLFIPDINLILGPSLFKKYLEDFDGRFAETIMSYNAGPEAAKRWQKKFFLPYCPDPVNCNGDRRIDATLILMEMVPYRETNAYVKKVFRNYFNYKRLLSQTPLATEDLKAIFY